MPTNHERTQRFITDVLGWQCFPSWEAYYAELWKTGQYVSLGHPVAFWYTQFEFWSVFYRDGEDARRFDPFARLDDAWLLIKCFPAAEAQLRVAPEQAAGLRLSFTDGRVVEAFGDTPCAAICAAVWKLLDAAGEDDADTRH